MSQIGDIQVLKHFINVPPTIEVTEYSQVVSFCCTWAVLKTISNSWTQTEGCITTLVSYTVIEIFLVSQCFIGIYWSSSFVAPRISLNYWAEPASLIQCRWTFSWLQQTGPNILRSEKSFRCQRSAKKTLCFVQLGTFSYKNLCS